jgi:hypothetical protein
VVTRPLVDPVVTRKIAIHLRAGNARRPLCGA